jgi:Ca-activated chloride channel family protein
VKFLWPQMLWLLLAVPAVASAYIYAMRRRSASAARFPGLAPRTATRKAPAIVRYLPPILFLIALATMLFAVARPTAVITLPSQHETVMLAFDVSGSMRATDVKPNRLAAAQAAARAFIDEQPRSTRIGVVSFAASATVVQHPTDDRDAVKTAIDRLQMQQGTALGSGIVVALGAMFPGQGITVDSVQNAAALRAEAPRERKKAPADEAKKSAPAASGDSAAIVLLTDGQANTGVPPAEAARVAAERRVRVFTIGVGTPAGETMTVNGWRMRVRLDEDTLKDIANVTRGQYFHAGNAKDLRQVYKTLNSRFTLQKRETEITAFFSAAAVIVAVLSAVLSFTWFNRIV